MKHGEKAWLSRQIRTARENLNQMPSHIKETARFEGNTRHQFPGRFSDKELS